MKHVENHSNEMTIDRRQLALTGLSTSLLMLMASPESFAQASTTAAPKSEAPTFTDWNGMRATWPGAVPTATDLIKINAPHIALAGKIEVTAEMDSAWAEVMAIFIRPTVVGRDTKFDGSEPTVFAVRYAPRVLPKFTASIKFSSSLRLLVAAYSGGKLYTAEQEIKLADATKTIR